MAVTTNKELTRRALAVCAGLNLHYMATSGAYDPADPSRPFGGDDDAAAAVGRFMIFNQTDGGDDGWVDFAPTAEAAARRVCDLACDEWGVTAVYDLAADEYARPVPLRISVALAGASYADTYCAR